MEMNHPFVGEIDINEIKLLGVLGKGSFGTVRKGKWRDLDVAVKLIETDQEKKAFLVEVQQLSRVNHANIVKLYGACTKTRVCLVMEYAEGGSLYNVLHCMKEVEYTAAHAISWLLQCAKGVAYLHNMKPQALIHRDLKPPNLLLVMAGTVLKICDFGTACDKHTFMTNSKGSAAWMAPEVFEGSQYNEKCDIFSWAIILWEVLTREKPFYDVGVSAFCIMWAVHNGTRPPLIANCPRPIEDLMTRCWSQDPLLRPSMSEVVDELSKIFVYYKGADKPISYVSQEESNSTESSTPCSSVSFNQSRSSESKTVLPTSHVEASSPVEVPVTRRKKEPVELIKSLESTSKDDVKRRSADFSSANLNISSHLGHRRSGSCDSPHISMVSGKVENGETVTNITAEKKADNSSASGFSPKDDQIGYPDAYLQLLEPKLQPWTPIPDCRESQEIYEEHCRAARELIRLKNEVSLLTERRNELHKKLQERDTMNIYIEEFSELKKEKESLLQLQQNLKRQLEIIKNKQKQEQGVKVANPSSDEWVLL